MSDVNEIVVTLPGKRRVDAQVRGHVIRTDQPGDNGGDDSAPTPFELFLASTATCAGIFVQGFCAKREIPYENIRVVQKLERDAEGRVAKIDLEVQLPADFPEKYRQAVVAAVEGCSVKKAIQAQPTFAVRSTLQQS